MILICGIPNAGKTTYSARFENVLHFDDVKGGRHRRDKVVDAVAENNSLVVEGVYPTAKERRRLPAASTERNVCIWLDVPVDECVRRELAGRNRSEHMVIWASERFEPPTLEEGWDEIVIIRGGNVESSNREK